MNATNYGAETLTKAARAAAEAFLAVLDEATGIVPTKSAAGDSASGDLIEYDPLHDDPPFTPNPQKSAPEAQQKLASITFLGAIGRIYAEEGRGANAKEISKFAKKAGYAGGNAVNGWNSRPDSPRAVELDESNSRFLNEGSYEWIQSHAAKLGINLAGEYKTVPTPKK